MRINHSPPPVSVRPRSASRTRWFRWVALLLPLIMLLALELALRLFSIGYPTSFFIHHPAAGSDRWVENQRFSWRFFPRTLARYPEPIIVDSRKPAGTYRIVIMGESAAQGDPAPAFGFSRVLQVLLRERYPGARFEIVNTAFTAINSHVILEIARDCRPLQADLWLIYMGHNEIVGPFGSATVFGKPMPKPLLRTQLLLRSTRTGQLLESLMTPFHRTHQSTQGWGGMNMFLNHQLRHDDPRLLTSQAQFEDNLTDILDLAQTAGAHVVLSTTVARLRDWAPFSSTHRMDWTPQQQAEWTREFQAGLASQTNHAESLALIHFTSAARIDPHFAELQFRMGQCLLALEREDDAHQHFVTACDDDALRFRADSALNQAIRHVASARRHPSVTLLDAARAFDSTSPHGIPGREWLLDHVHLNFTGNYQLARLFADAVVAALPLTVPDSAENSSWLSEEECASQLAYTDVQRHALLTLVQHRLNEPVYNAQIDHHEHLSHLSQELLSLRGAPKPAARRQSLEVVRQALQKDPGDWRLHELSARLYDELGLGEESIQAWQKVSELIPHSPGPHVETGKLRLRQADPTGALAAFRRAAQLNPRSSQAQAGLGNCQLRMGHDSEAVRYFHRALKLDPTCRDAIAGLNQRRIPQP